MTNSKYFFPGYYSTYALYSSDDNCFLFLDNDPELLKVTKMLVASKFSVYLCDLTTAPNYDSKKLSNFCCENWTFKNSRNISFGPEIPGVLSTENILLKDNYQTIQIGDYKKTWLHMTAHYVNFLSRIRKYNMPNSDKWSTIEKFMSEVFGDEVESTVNKEFFYFVENLYKELYLGDDINATEGRIINLIESSSYKQSYSNYISNNVPK